MDIYSKNACFHRIYTAIDELKFEKGIVELIAV